MTNAETIAQLRRWQECGFVHPLTCRGGGGTCPGDAIDLEPVELDGKVVLRCPGCGRIQEWVPPVCLSADLTKHPLAERYRKEQQP